MQEHRHTKMQLRIRAVMALPYDFFGIDPEMELLNGKLYLFYFYFNFNYSNSNFILFWTISILMPPTESTILGNPLLINHNFLLS